MSLAVAALRLCAVKSLDNATSAGARVFDSVVDPRKLIGDNALPAIVIYADTGKRRPRGRDILTADCHVDLVIELFVAKATKITVPAQNDESGQQTQEAFDVEYPQTDAGYENRLRRLAYEIESTFAGGAGSWPELWRRSVVTFSQEHDSEWERGADSSNGGRFNFLRLIYRVIPPGDPQRGVRLEPGSYWDDFLTQATADEELRALALDWRALIETKTLPEWRQQAAALGLTSTELDNIGLAPLAAPNDATADLPALAEITIDPLGTQLVAGPMTEIAQDA